LRGPNLDMFGPRFIALSDAYDLELRRVAHLAWKEITKDQTKKMDMREGVYAFVGGPKYDPPCQSRMSRLTASATKPEQSAVCSQSSERIL
jgi:purine-nucleoside phosphorylase